MTHHSYQQVQAISGAHSIEIEQYIPLVKKLAGLLISRLPASVDINDLIQVGMIGLIESARQFNLQQGVQFETFASQRVRGAMLDELRRMDWVPRQVRRNMRRIEEAIDSLEQQLGRAPMEAEIAAAMQITLVDYQEMLSDSRGGTLLYFEDFTNEEVDHSACLIDNVVDPSARNPMAVLADDGFRQRLVEAITQLPEREQLVMSLYYEQELNLKEIGAVLGVSESRVSQLHSQAVARLRVRLKDWLQG